QREKQIQAFHAMRKDFSTGQESISNLEKLPVEKASFDSLPDESVEKTKRKSSDLLEIGYGDSKIDTLNRVDTVQIKDVQSNKITHVPVPEVFHKVESMVHQGGGKMTLVLTPPELGQVEIHVSTKGKNVEVSVKSDNDFAKMAIESQVADLQQSLQSQDLNLSKIEVQVSREMDPSFLENQFAGFSRQGNSYQQPEGYRQDNSSRSPWKMEAAEMDRRSSSISNINVANANRAGARWTESRVDIRI
ncbi:flagellar hook-length control protein FliK, partial [bacterium]|nr:flagellar hook-length control protein FliK [bacterium]